MNEGFEKWKGYSASTWKEDIVWKVYDATRFLVRAIHASYKGFIKLFDFFDIFSKALF